VAFAVNLSLIIKSISCHYAVLCGLYATLCVFAVILNLEKFPKRKERLTLKKMFNLSPYSFSLSAGFSDHGNASAFKGHNPIHFCKDGMITAQAHIVAGLVFRAALTNQNVSGAHELTTIAFHAQTVGIGISTV
jgi:hypothetical protein